MIQSVQTSRYKLLVSAFIIAFLVPHVWVAIRGIDAFPFTSAPMFGREISTSRPIFKLHAIGRFGDGSRELPFKEIGLHPRHMFVHFYGAGVTPNQHAVDFSKDTPQAFSERMTRWFSIQVDRYTQITGQTPPDTVDLVLEQVHPVDAHRKLLVGTYRVQEKLFAPMSGVSYRE